MFTQKIAIKSLATPFLIGLAAIVMVSCGTQNRAYNQNDGIYASGGNSNTQEENRTDENNESSKANYYQQYFQAKSMSYENAQQEEDVIFTDIDAYATSERLDEDGNIIIEQNYADEDYGPWGSNSDNVSVNIYNHGNYGHGYGYGFYNPYHWSYPYYGYYGPSWRFSFGWGYPYYGGYYGGHFGYPYYGYPYYGYGYGSGYPYYPNSVSYNRGRRNTDYNRTETRGRTNNASTRNSYSRSENTRRINQNNVRANSREN